MALVKRWKCSQTAFWLQKQQAWTSCDWRHAEENRRVKLMDDEGYSSEGDSFLSSIDSRICRGVEENGRLYPSYGRHEYGLPVDEREQERNALRHETFNMLEQLCGDDTQIDLGQFFKTPGRRVLDLGTGSGLWPIEIADRFPHAEVIGTDIAPIQPLWVPPNCSFEIDDVEADWTYPAEHFDLIHARELLLSIRDWPRLIEQAYRAIRPGGWVQLACTIPPIKLYGNPLPPNSALQAVGDAIIDVGERTGTSPEAVRWWRRDLTHVGFVNIHEATIPLPVGPWTRNAEWRLIGSMERALIHEGMESMLLRGWTRFLGRSREDLDMLLQQARKELNNPKLHARCDLHIVYGQRPQGEGVPPHA